MIPKLSKKQTERLYSLMRGGIPKYIRIYDNLGKTIDRYTVIFTGRYRKAYESYQVLIMSDTPWHPQGFCQHDECLPSYDRPNYGHLGKKISYDDLTIACKNEVLMDYLYYWGYADEHGYWLGINYIVKPNDFDFLRKENNNG